MEEMTVYDMSLFDQDKVVVIMGDGDIFECEKFHNMAIVDGMYITQLVLTNGVTVEVHFDDVARWIYPNMQSYAAKRLGELHMTADEFLEMNTGSKVNPEMYG